MNNLQKLQVLTDQLEVQENDFIDYVLKAEYAILLVSNAGRIKWCNDFFYNLFGYDKDEIVNKGLKRIFGVDLCTLESKRLKLKTKDETLSEFILKKSELTRKGKLIHKKIALIPNE
tara:strand:+ start:449 stop:799 length:351 start_codon:yes stop_codon:yes gene_type:complete